MARLTLAGVPLIAALTAAACSSNPFTAPTDTSTPATEVTEAFEGQLTVNGAATHTFQVQRPGAVTLRLVALDPSESTIGLSLGTWNANSNVCSANLSNDAAAGGATVVGAASLSASPGAFCARVYDVGRLSRPVLYSLSVTHF